jgi:hypothetical protein
MGSRIADSQRVPAILNPVIQEKIPLMSFYSCTARVRVYCLGMEENNTNLNGATEMNTETNTITCKFTATEDSDRVITQRVSITLPASAPMTDFSDAAWEVIESSYPEHCFVDEL